MFEERYKQAISRIHAGDDLIAHTLDVAERRHSRSTHAGNGLRLLLATLCVVVLITGATLQLSTPPKDLLTLDEPFPSAPSDFLPLTTDRSSDDLKFSVSDVKLVNKHEVSFILTVTGDRIDPHSSIDYDYDHGAILLSSTQREPADCEGQPANEKRFLNTLTTDDRPILDVLGSRLDMWVSRYTCGDQHIETVHNIDWNTVDFTLPEAGEPIIDLGGGLAVTGFGFTEEGWLTLQVRWPYDAPDPTFVLTWLSPGGTNDDLTSIYMRGGRQYAVGDYCYYNQIFHVTRDELDGMSLVTFTTRVGEVILGSWPFTVDLSHLSAE